MKKSFAKKGLALVLVAMLASSMCVLANAETATATAPAVSEVASSVTETAAQETTAIPAASEAVIGTSSAVQAEAEVKKDPEIKGYSVSFEDGQMVVKKDGKKVCAYGVRSAKLTLYSDAQGDLILGFVDDKGATRRVSLGAETLLTVEGTAESVTVDRSVKRIVDVVLASQSKVTNLSVDNASDVLVQGNVFAARISGPAKVKVPQGGLIGDFTAITGHARLDADENTVISVKATSNSVISGSKALVPVEIESVKDEKEDEEEVPTVGATGTISDNITTTK